METFVIYPFYSISKLLMYVFLMKEPEEERFLQIGFNKKKRFFRLNQDFQISGRPRSVYRIGYSPSLNNCSLNKPVPHSDGFNKGVEFATSRHCEAPPDELMMLDFIATNFNCKKTGGQRSNPLVFWRGLWLFFVPSVRNFPSQYQRTATARSLHGKLHSFK